MIEWALRLNPDPARPDQTAIQNCFSQRISLTSGGIDCALTAMAASSFFFPPLWTENGLVQGMRAFALVNFADRALRKLLLKKVEKKEEPILEGALNALVVEGIYSGILMTRSAWGILPRFAVSWIVGATAARGVAKEKVSAKISLDNQIGFLWAVFREVASSCLPARAAVPFLIAEDSAIFGLCEVCPKKRLGNALPRSSPEWVYKTLSSRIFRVTANLFALHAGLPAAVLQHLLFNFSRSFPE